MSTVPPLYKHQEGDIETELANDRVLDTSDPGTGKTRTRLEVFAKRRVKGAGCMLAIVPKSAIHSTWANDCRKFTPWLTTSEAYAENREEAFAQAADIFITNHDAVKWLAQRPDSFFEKFDSLVIDESTAFKHPNSQRSKAINKIKKHFKYRCVMTGTPNTNSITDLWNQVYIVDDGERLGGSYWAFRSATQVPKQVGKSPKAVKWEDRPGVEVTVGGMINDITIRHIFEECHDIPPNLTYQVPYQMKPRHLALYNTMKDDAVLQLKTGEISAIHAASLVTKLLQIASGAVYDAEGDYHVVDTSRYELIADLVEARKHSIVFFNWVHQRDLLMEEFKKRGITSTLIDGSVSKTRREAAVTDYQAGMYRVLLAHPQSAAHSLTLTRGTSTIWSSPTYNLEHYLQGNRRIYRAGQTQKTETVDVLAEQTIEGHVYDVRVTKNGKLVDLLGMLT